MQIQKSEKLEIQIYLCSRELLCFLHWAVRSSGLLEYFSAVMICVMPFETLNWWMIISQEFQIEKLQLVEAEKKKIRQDYEKKEKQVDIKKKM